jgi:GNAT superfamily N-acetyltransferase
MDLELVTASAFDEHDGFTEHWWNGSIGDHPQYRFIQVRRDRVEVARVELDEKVHTAHYQGAPDLGDIALEIQFIEVSDKYRRQGIGAAVVRRLAELHPDRRLVAYSEEADRFWSKLGWRPYYHPEERGPRWRTLFIQPAAWPLGDSDKGLD